MPRQVVLDAHGRCLSSSSSPKQRTDKSTASSKAVVTKGNLGNRTKPSSKSETASMGGKEKQETSKSKIMTHYFEEFAQNMATAAHSPAKKKRSTLNSRAAEQIWIPDFRVLDTESWRETEEALVQRALLQSTHDLVEPPVGPKEGVLGDQVDEDKARQEQISDYSNEDLHANSYTAEETTQAQSSHSMDLNDRYIRDSFTPSEADPPASPQRYRNHRHEQRQEFVAVLAEDSVTARASSGPSTTHPMPSKHRRRKRLMDAVVVPSWQALWKRLHFMGSRLEDLSWIDERFGPVCTMLWSPSLPCISHPPPDSDTASTTTTCPTPAVSPAGPAARRVISALCGQLLEPAHDTLPTPSLIAVPSTADSLLQTSITTHSDPNSDPLPTASSLSLACGDGLEHALQRLGAEWHPVPWDDEGLDERIRYLESLCLDGDTAGSVWERLAELRLGIMELAVQLQRMQAPFVTRESSSSS